MTWDLTMEDRIDLTVAICTRNRAGLLERTLDHLRKVEIPAGCTWELIVVDNGSSDATARVLAAVSDLPLRVLQESRDGKSHAANRATQAARGKLIVWTDDDVRPGPGWVTAYLGAAARHPKAAFFGGPVRPWFERPPPPWLARGIEEIALPYALLDLGCEERALRPDEKCNGPNWAVRAAVARRFSWNPELGPRRRARIPGGEAWVQARMQENGERGYWIPGATVAHFVPATSMSLDYIAYRYRLHGKALMLGRPNLGAALRSVLSCALEAYPRYLLGRLAGVSPCRWLRQYRRAQTHLGKLGGWLGRGILLHDAEEEPPPREEETPA